MAGGDSTSSASLAVDMTWDIGRWIHLTGVCDGQRWKLYRNGDLSSVSAPVNGYTGANASGGLVIGANGPPANGTSGPTANFFSGTVNGVRLYNRARQPRPRSAPWRRFRNGAAGCASSRDAATPPTKSRLPTRTTRGRGQRSFQFQQDGGHRDR